jgi:hypothetical protein
MGSGKPNGKGGVNWDEIELVECSVVSVPSNREAVRIAKSFGVDLRSLEVVPGMAASGLNPASLEAIVAAKRAAARTNLLLRNRQ